jgi:hypothetical protein
MNFTNSTLQGPIINNINNGQLNAIRAMPQKDSTSDGDSTFEMSRGIYTRTLPNNPTNTPTTHTTYNWQARRNVQQTTSLPTGESSNYINGKKWYGNRDASQVTTNRRTTQVGVGSLNANNQTMGFATHGDANTTRDALRRVRAGGAVAPAKKGANKNNNLTPSFAPNPDSKLDYGIKKPYLNH